MEAEQKEVNQQLIRTDQEIESATIKRPTAKQVQESWSEIEELWGDVLEDERQELLASFVTQVEVKQKDRASMKLLPIPEGHGLKFVTRSQLGAGTGNTYTFINPRCQRVTLFVPSGGKCRVKIPRSERQGPLTETP